MAKNRNKKKKNGAVSMDTADIIVSEASQAMDTSESRAKIMVVGASNLAELHRDTQPEKPEPPTVQKQKTNQNPKHLSWILKFHTTVPIQNPKQPLCSVLAHSNFRPSSVPFLLIPSSRPSSVLAHSN
ncbi:hypothetical protein QL285_082605 [Trifolium repens]|nr:hypothetical protein QL285_082605 [Trifolium repens]